MYAAHQSIAPPISDEYNAKGESLETLRDFHDGKLAKGGDLLSNYTFAQQFVTPFVVLVFVWNILYHLFSNNKLKLIRDLPASENKPTEETSKTGEDKTKDASKTGENKNKDASKTGEDKTKNSYKTDSPEHSQRNMTIYTNIICSYIAVLYIISLDCVAVAI